jgi:hypothetical protein
MYLSDEKRAQIRKCFEKQQFNAKVAVKAIKDAK